MEEGFKYLFRILLILFVVIAVAAIILLLRKTGAEETNSIKDIFSNLFKFS